MKAHNKQKRSKLYVRIPIIIASVIAVVMLVMTTFLAVIANRTVKKMTKQELKYIAEHNAEEVESYLNNMLTFSKALSVEVKRYRGLEAETAKYVLLDSLKGVLDDKKIFSAYYAFEPDIYFTNTPDGISYYAYRDGAEIGIDVLKDYDSYGTADYYLPAKQNLTTHVTEPYLWELSNGEKVTLVTLSTPIVDENGRFMGVANCDIDVNYLLDLDYSKGGFSKAYHYVVSNDGSCIVHSVGQDRSTLIPKEIEKNPKIRTAVEENRFLSTEIGASELKSGKALAIYHPVKINGADVNWMTAFIVDKSEAMGAVLRITIPVVVISILGLIILIVVSKVTIKKALAPVDTVMDMANKMGECELKGHDYKVLNTNDELGMLSGIFAETSKTIACYIQEISDILHQIAKGDLTNGLESEYKGDFNGIKNDINTIIDSLNLTFGKMKDIAVQVAENAANFEYTSNEMGQGSIDQAAAIEELVSRVSEITGQVAENADNVREINNKAIRVGAELNSSNEKMQQLLEAMQSITETSAKIGNIIHTIEDIAFQTNILALNAAVEAARAGNAGKGFAVVADEVRNLASKSAEAAQNTKDLIQNSMLSVNEGAKYANATAESLHAVVEDAKSITVTIAEISQKTDEQSAALNEVSSGISNISDIVQSNAAMAQENAENSEELAQQAAMLKSSIHEFKLKEQ